MATSIGKQIMHRTRRDIAERALGQALGLLGNNHDRNANYLISAIDHIVSGDKQGIIRDWVHNWLDEGKPGCEFWAGY